jgi:hypothetical protein
MVVPWQTSTQIILFSIFLKVSKNKKSLWRKIENILEYSQLIPFKTWNAIKKIKIIQHRNVELALELALVLST